MITYENGKLLLGGVEIANNRITFEIMLADAIERKSIEAYNFLNAECHKVVEKTKKSGGTYKVAQNVNVYRNDYLTKFCGYTPKPKKVSTLAKKEKLLANALKLING